MDVNECVLLLADIHANELALQAIIKDARKRCRQLPKIWFLGDLFGRGPDPAVVWDRLTEYQPEAMIVGNHDWGLACIDKNFDIVDEARSIKFKEHEWDVILQHRQQLQEVGLLDTVVDTLRNKWPVVCAPAPGIYMIHGGVEKAFDKSITMDRMLNSLVWGYGSKNAEMARVTLKAARWVYENWDEQEPRLKKQKNEPLQPPALVLVGHLHRRAIYYETNKQTKWITSIELGRTYELPENSSILVSPGGAGFRRERDVTDKEGSYAILRFEDGKVRDVVFYKAPFDRRKVLQRMQELDYDIKVQRHLHVPGDVG